PAPHLPPPSLPTRRSSDLHHEPPAHLAVHLHHDLHVARRGEPFVIRRPRGREDRALVAEGRPEILGKMRRVGSEHDERLAAAGEDRKSTRLNSSHQITSYA